jgi:hypothetical protein
VGPGTERLSEIFLYRKEERMGGCLTVELPDVFVYSSLGVNNFIILK